MRNYKHVKSCNENKKYLSRADARANNMKCNSHIKDNPVLHDDTSYTGEL